MGMAEYIEREALLCMVQPDDPSDENAAITIATAKKLIRNIVSRTPAANVAPVRHGRWVQVICHEEFEDGFVDRVKECCSVCHAPNGRKTTNYCPDCGAKMDGGVD